MSVLTTNNLAKSFGADDIFDSINVEVPQGARVALVHVQVWQEDPSRPIVTARSHCLLPAREG